MKIVELAERFFDPSTRGWRGGYSYDRVAEEAGGVAPSAVRDTVRLMFPIGKTHSNMNTARSDPPAASTLPRNPATVLREEANRLSIRLRALEDRLEELK